MGVFCHVFFFMRKPAYERLRSLVGSEMCISDGPLASHPRPVPRVCAARPESGIPRLATPCAARPAVSYTQPTLPTFHSVQISVVAASLKKKN